MIKKNILFIYLFLVGLLNAAEWFDNNRNLKNIFPEKIWYYVERADYYDTRGNLSVADSYLRLAQRKTDEAKPFNSANWPKGWPQRRDALKILKYASPDAYLNKLIGDFALYHSRPKEALIYYSTYLELSIIPDTDIMMKMAEIYKKENRWRDAKVIYDKISKTIDANNFHGTKFSLTLLSKLSKDAELKLIKPSILTLDILFRNIPDFKFIFNWNWAIDIRNSLNQQI